MSPHPAALTEPQDETLDANDTSKTSRYLRAVYFGIPVPPHSADVPLPTARAGSAATTVDLRARRQP